MRFDRPGAQRAPLHIRAHRLGVHRAAALALALLIAGGFVAVHPAGSTAAAAVSPQGSEAPTTVTSTTATSSMSADLLQAASSLALSDVTTGTVTTTASTVPEPSDPAPGSPLTAPAPTAEPVTLPGVPGPEPTAEPSPAPDSAPVPGTSATPRQPKVVVIVGPVGGKTREYIRSAKRLAATARSYGAKVIELYSPNATWARVSKAADDASVLIYLGHGNGWPTGHGPFNPKTKNGLGLNARAGAGNYNTRYYGEALIARSIDFAENAVVILNRLCYASGNNEWGRGNPSKSTAIKRVDNYGAGFLEAGAAAVFAEGITDARYILRNLFKTDRTMKQIFWSSPKATGRYDFTVKSRRTAGASAVLDPYARSRYYRSVVGDLAVTAEDWRLGDAAQPTEATAPTETAAP